MRTAATKAPKDFKSSANTARRSPRRPVGPGERRADARLSGRTAELGHQVGAGHRRRSPRRPRRGDGVYRGALKIAPDEPTILTNMGLSYALAKQLPDAERLAPGGGQPARRRSHPRRSRSGAVAGRQIRGGRAGAPARMSPETAHANVVRSADDRPTDSWRQLQIPAGKAPGSAAGPRPKPPPRPPVADAATPADPDTLVAPARISTF